MTHFIRIKMQILQSFRCYKTKISIVIKMASYINEGTSIPHCKLVKVKAFFSLKHDKNKENMEL